MLGWAELRAALKGSRAACQKPVTKAVWQPAPDPVPLLFSRALRMRCSLSAVVSFLLLLVVCRSEGQDESRVARSHHGGLQRGASRQGGGHPHGLGANGKQRRRRCGGADHVSLTRPCASNDTYCGDWNGNFFEPLGCSYQDITGAQARKCLGNRTLAFIGDSMIRDICMGVVNLLSDVEVSPEASDTKFDHERLNTEHISKRIADFKSWKHNVPSHNYNGHIFPIPGNTSFEWQVQMWSLYRNEFVDAQVDDVLSNYKLMVENPELRHIDQAFWNHGLHDWGWWDKPPMGDRYFEIIVERWLRARKLSEIPTVWVSMNPNCRKKINFSLGDMDKQAVMVEEGNRVANARTLKESLPYWDAAAVLKTPSRCDQSADGVHVKMFVDKMRAKMLFNHLCDHAMNWRGGKDFIGFK